MNRRKLLALIGLSPLVPFATKADDGMSPSEINNAMRSSVVPFEPFIPDRLEAGERNAIWGDGLYVIRDVWSDGGHYYREGLTLARCEYAVRENGTKVWKPCIEGVLYADIEPLYRFKRRPFQ